MTKITKLFATILLLAGVLLCQNAPQYPATAAGRTMASEYGQWAVQSLNTVSASSTSMTLTNCFVKVGTGNKQIFPFATSVPVTIVDGSNTENVTITAVTSPTANTGASSTVNPYNCSFTATFANSHQAGVNIVSNDGGLAEAINDIAGKGGVVTLDSNFNPGGTAVAATTAIFTNVGIEDIRGSQPVFYTLQPSTLTALATPATRSATAGNTQVVSGTATGTWTAAAQFVCVTYVDILGGESPCSATYNFTATASVALNFASPAASTGAVGWRAYAGLTSLSTAYQLPISASTCTLSTLTPYPTCAIGAAGVFPTPTTTTALASAAGGVAATYRPNTQSHTTFAYQPGSASGFGAQRNYGPFIISPALTAGQSVVLGAVPFPTALLNGIGRTIRVSGKFTNTFSTGGSQQVIVGFGDTTDFSTGTPKAVCTFTSTGALTTVAYNTQFSCDITTNATGATGSVSPDGFSVVQVSGGTTTAAEVDVESATGAITVDVLDPMTLYVSFLQTSAAESTTPPQLQTLHVEVL